MFILLALVAIPLSTYGLEVGDECPSHLSSVPAVCDYASKCEDKISNWSREERMNKTCGIVEQPSRDMLLCCPIERVTKSSFFTVLMRNVTFDTKVPGSLAQAKCAENADITEHFDSVFHHNFGCKTIRMQNFNNSFVNQEEYPHATLFILNDGTAWPCMGNLISDDAILTAAHCVRTPHVTVKWVKTGAVNASEDADYDLVQIFKIKEIIIHPQYNPESIFYKNRNDIAIVRLNRKIIRDEQTRPACLPVKLPELTEEAIALKWEAGTHMTYSPDDARLVKSIVNITSNLDCDGTYFLRKPDPNHPDPDLRNLICTEKSSDNNMAQAGSSLVVFNEDHQCMYTILGFSYNQNPTLYGARKHAYLNVQRYIQWIEKTVWPEYFGL